MMKFFYHAFDSKIKEFDNLYFDQKVSKIEPKWTKKDGLKGTFDPLSFKMLGF